MASTPPPRAYVIKADLGDAGAASFDLVAQKTMYGGRQIAEGDIVYLLASENSGGAGLVARGVVTAARPVPPRTDAVRQTPRVSVQVQRTALARRPLGRTELKAFSDWQDGQPQTELNFKCYRQATDKIVGIEAATAVFLDSFF